jgi:hypothetical protein
VIVAAGGAEEVQGDFVGRVEDDVPDGGVWVNGGLSTVFEGPTWE